MLDRDLQAALTEQGMVGVDGLPLVCIGPGVSTLHRPSSRLADSFGRGLRGRRPCLLGRVEVSRAEFGVTDAR